MNNPSAWVNTTVVIQGTLTQYPDPSNSGLIGFSTGPYIPPGFEIPPDIIPPPWNYTLSSSNGIGNIGVLWNGTAASPNYSQVQICGVVRQGIEEDFFGTNTTVFYIEALTVDWSSPLQSVFFLFNLQPTLFFSDLQGAYGSRVNNSSQYSNADLNKDGIVDLKDLVLFARTSPLLLNISATDYGDRDGASWTNVTLFVENASQCILTYAEQGSLDGTVVVNATGNETMLRTGNQYSATFDCSGYSGYGSSMLWFNTEVYVLDKQGQSTLVASYNWGVGTGPFLP